MNALGGRGHLWIAFTLRWGSFLSAGLLLAGVVWLALAQGGDRPLQIGSPMPAGKLLRQLVEGNPYALMQAGVVLLLLTPLLRLVVAAISFWVEGERRYTLVSLVVLAMILLSAWLARAG